MFTGICDVETNLDVRFLILLGHLPWRHPIMNLQLCIYVQTYSVRSLSLAKCVEASANSQNVAAAGSMGADGDLDQPTAANMGLLIFTNEICGDP